MRAVVLTLSAVAAIIGGYHEVAAHHIGAPSDPYRAVPRRQSLRELLGARHRDPWPGVIHYMGATEIASCGASLTITGG